MTVHDLGYRAWSGEKSPGIARLGVIAGVGVRRAWQSKWLKRLLFFAWMPTVYFGVGFFMFEQALLQPDLRQQLQLFLRGMTVEHLDSLVIHLDGDTEAARILFWSWMLLAFFRYTQLTLIVLVVGLVAPPLISQDIRSRAFLLYFSRPIHRFEYVLGKALSIWTYLAIISLLPALSLYGLGILLSPELSDVLSGTWDLPLRIAAASATTMIPTAAIAICFSSMTQESRIAAFAWFAMWVLGSFTYTAGRTSEVIVSKGDTIGFTDGPWSHASVYHTITRVQEWIFGFRTFDDTSVSLALLVGLTVVSLVIVFRRVDAPMRA